MNIFLSAKRRRSPGVTSYRRASHFILHPSSFIPCVALFAFVINFASNAQQRSGAHSTAARDTFTASDRRLVERAIGATCAERARDPQGSMPIDEMQSRPSLPVNNPDAVAGARRADRLLPATRKLVAETIIKLAKEYDSYGGVVSRGKINGSVARVQSVKRVKPDVDARDNASVVLREPRTIEFGTIFLAGLRSDKAMIGVLAHELTHIASGQPDALKPLFRAIGRRAATRTGLRIQGQPDEELSCDLVGALAVREYIKETPSWEPLPRRLARAFEHNCVDDDASDEDHLSPRNTIRALFALEVGLANEILSDVNLSTLWLRANFDLVRGESVGKSKHHDFFAFTPCFRSLSEKGFSVFSVPPWCFFFLAISTRRHGDNGAYTEKSAFPGRLLKPVA